MSRTMIMVVGANGSLGRTVLTVLGPTLAIAATRYPQTPVPGYAHVRLGPDGCPPRAELELCRAIINVAGSVTGDASALEAANVQLPLAIARAAAAAGIVKMVQVSSFAVYGAVDRIDAATPQRPINLYGESKVRGDEVLSALRESRLVVESVRLPFMFSANKPGLLAPLIKLADVLRILPDTAPKPVQRSMITYAAAAQNLVDCAAIERGGISHAADPKPFTYALLTQILSETTHRRISVVKVPSLATNAMSRVMPGVSRRLLKSNLLDPQINRAAKIAPVLETELRALVRLRYGP